ncbi:cation:proton antiporter [Photobacterium lipolyticum]|uniref:Sodium:proton antiporter n=1 Tax=Photobacterium lipolyticum TaxID=266810 RepID=A0A2T3N5G1_9GAMM|nr:sodium:proton antiporter [Photobacterium lipolyticum]PSW07696.1 sodium:proton antiporter [Photobacterium lipolyticum]
MHDISFLVIVFLVLGLVGLNALTYYSHRIMVLPDIVWVLLLGVLYGFLSTYLGLGLPKITLNSQLVLYAFVPLLIFASTQKICLHHIRNVLVPASLIGSVGILISMAVIGAVLHFVFGMPWLATLLFGVIISATDPLAIGALLHENKEIQESRKLLIEGESILNDGFVVTVFGVFVLLMFEGETFSLINSSASLLTHIIGALIIGVVLGRAARWLLAYWRGEHFTLRTNMTMALAYGSLLLAESLHFSGILAVFAAALAYGYKRPEPDNNTLIQRHLWDYFEYIANACLFFLLGASFIGLASFELLTFSLVIASLVLLLVARLIAIFLLLPFISLEGKSLTHQEFWLLNFAGARGAVSIALILLLPDSFELKETFLSIAFVMILFSLVLYPLVIQRLQRRAN